MQRDSIYIYGKHAIEEATKHAPHAIKRVFTEKKSAGADGTVAIVDAKKLLIPYKDFALSATPNTAVVVLAGLTDPHNVGAIIRSAAAFGFAAVIMPTSNQAPLTTAVAKTSAGMVFRIPLVITDSLNATLADLKNKGFAVYGLAGKGATQLGEEKFAKPTTIVVGNEGFGMTAETESLCDTLLSIPIHSRTESLNAAAAAAVVMYDWSMKHPDALN